MIPFLVVDASVVVKWFVIEDKTDVALRLPAAAQRLVAPDVLRAEVGSAIIRRVRMGEMEGVDGRRCCEELLGMLYRQAVLLFHSNDDFSDALMLALQLRHAVADCLYLALAQRLDAPLITADSGFYEKAKALYPKMEML